MTPEHEIEYMDAKIKSMLQSFSLDPKRVDAMAYDFIINETAPQASTLDLSTDVPVDETTTNKIMMVMVIPKSGDDCPKLTESKHIKLSVTHFKPEPESKHCYYHFYGDGFMLNGMVQEIKMIVRDAVRENKRRKKESGIK